jgi:putative tricarboxylic transport membrane protein
VNGSVLDLWLMAGFGLAGYLLRKLGFDVAPLLLAMVLGDRIEVSLRRALTISNGDYRILVQSGIARGCLAALVVIAVGLGITRYAAASRRVSARA